MKTLVLATVLTVSAAFVSAQTATAPPARAKTAATVGMGSYIGVGLQEIDSERAKALKLREEVGVEITSVTPDSPAEKAGLKSGDVVLQYNGQRVDGMDQFKRMVTETPVGRDAKLEIFRNGAAQTVIVKVGARRSPMAAMPRMMTPDGAFATIPMEPMEIHIPDIPRALMSWRSSILGVDVEGIDGQLAQYFGVKEGVLVRSVNSASPAEKSGIKAGDVIVKVEDSAVANPADLSNRLRAYRGKNAAMTVMRDRREMNLSIAVSEDLGNEWFFKQTMPAPKVGARPMRIE